MLLAAAAALAPTAATAATYNVDSTVDAPAANPASGCASTASGAPCTLRGAVQAANAAGGANTIQLPPGDFELTIAPTGTSDASTGNLDVTSGTLTVTGAGQTATTIDGNDLDRIFNVQFGASLALSDVTLQGGRPVPLSGLGLAPGVCPAGGLPAEGDGGAILSAGALTLTDDTLTQNSANGSGGAVDLTGFGTTVMVTGTTVTSNTSCEPTSGFPSEFNSGGGINNANGAALTIDSSTINDNQVLGQFGEGGGVAEGVNVEDSIAITSSTLDGNHADLDGGGVGVEGGGEIDLYRDTLAGNSAAVEGGGFGDDGDDTDNIADTTITGNTAGTAGGNSNLGGGGFFTGAGNATIAFSTITDNTSVTDPGGNLDNGEGTINLADSIVAGGVGSGGAQENCSGFVNSEGHNLFDTAGSDCGAVASDVLNAANPVGPLADNGGPTFTQALRQGSPAIDAADPVVCGESFAPPATVGAGSIDQRGVARPQGPGTNCDIGAFEAGDADLAVMATANASSVQVGQQVTFTDVITNNGPVPATGVTFTDPTPAGFAIASTSTSQGSCTHTATTVSCAIGTLPVGSTATVLILVTTTSAGLLDEISHVTGNEFDPNPNNNLASVAVTVTATPTPAPTPTPTPTPAKPISGLKSLSLKGVPRACTRASLTLHISVRNKRPPQTTVVELDGRRIASSTRASFKVSIALSRFAVGRHTLTIKATDRTHRTLTIRAHFSRCTPPPRFTG